MPPVAKIMPVFIVAPPEDKAALVAALEEKLPEGEKLVWSGQPQASKQAERASNILGTASAMFAASIFLYMGFVNMTDHNSITLGPYVTGGLMLVGGITLFVGLHIFTTPDRVRKEAEMTLYAVTNRAAYILIPHGPGEGETYQWKWTSYSGDFASPEMKMHDGHIEAVDIGDVFYSLTVADASRAEDALGKIGKAS